MNVETIQDIDIKGKNVFEKREKNKSNGVGKSICFYEDFIKLREKILLKEKEILEKRNKCLSKNDDNCYVGNKNKVIYRTFDEFYKYKKSCEENEHKRQKEALHLLNKRNKNNNKQIIESIRNNEKYSYIKFKKERQGTVKYLKEYFQKMQEDNLKKKKKNDVLNKLERKPYMIKKDVTKGMVYRKKEKDDDIINGDIINDDIINDDIINDDIINGDIINGDIINGDITNDDIINGDIINGDIINGDIINDDITNDDITNDNIINDDITNDDITNDNITNGDIINGDIINDDITNDDITNDNITNDNITNDNTPNDYITNDNTPNDYITNYLSIDNSENLQFDNMNEKEIKLLQELINDMKKNCKNDEDYISNVIEDLYNNNQIYIIDKIYNILKNVDKEILQESKLNAINYDASHLFLNNKEMLMNGDILQKNKKVPSMENIDINNMDNCKNQNESIQKINDYKRTKKNQAQEILDNMNEYMYYNKCNNYVNCNKDVNINNENNSKLFVEDDNLENNKNGDYGDKDINITKKKNSKLIKKFKQKSNKNIKDANYTNKFDWFYNTMNDIYKEQIVNNQQEDINSNLYEESKDIFSDEDSEKNDMFLWLKNKDIENVLCEKRATMDENY
ncbi:hypothetical protein PFMC_04538 [Plasmodium falciparum CAMP/Malaysia]|uniref:CCAAT-box DNA binding protein subunit B n=1 Tax=Plasmodium falciparum (isolate Camp / Malaysia) TaxID=5835 RepID=A0A024X2H9_PLAFC|nr:hypothetical protein PFMC_04538 [Plasmodium falciparum CAMP/Malaysia]